ncbi:hypothetical protein, partial [Pararhizobium sp. BT-229]|uniref:hypothetical protein n=1 Tax=Pararhizobium sp. BT-229 TaxID=2986923 RepID=UPI0021F70D9F
MRRRHQRHPAGDYLRQNLDPLQVALAHRYQSHPQSPTSSKRGESDILTLHKQDTLTLRCEFTPKRDLGLDRLPGAPDLGEEFLAEDFGGGFVAEAFA